MRKQEKNPVLSFVYALNGISLAMNIMMLTAYYMEKDEEFIPFTSLQESYEKLNKCIDSAADPEKNGNIQDIYI